MSLPTPGQLIGAAIGVGLSFLIPGIGIVVGFTIGLGIGTFIDPPSIEQPDPSPFAQQDLQFNTFAKNLPVPIVYGVNRIGGNIIWIGNTRSTIIEHPVEGGGKGGPPDPPPTQEIRFGADFAAAIGEGSIAGVAQVWVDDDDISDKEGLNFTVFPGSNTQVPPSQMITALGSDAPAFRNLAYTLFTGDLGNLNRIPIINQLVAGIAGGITPAQTLVWSFNTNRVIGIEFFKDRPEIGIFHDNQFGRIGRSTDAGKTWTHVHCPGGTEAFDDTHMIGVHEGVAGRAYAFGAGGVGNPIIRSEDYGATWGNSFALAGAFSGEPIGVKGNSFEALLPVRGVGANIFKTYDGGLTWSSVLSTGLNGVSNMEFMFNFPDTNIWVCKTGLAGHWFRSTDNGDNWTHILSGFLPVGGQGVGLTPTIGIGGDNENIYRTTDAGLTWSFNLRYGDNGGSTFVRARNHDGTGYIFGIPQNPELCVLMASVDAGLNWICAKTDAPGFQDIAISDLNVCYGDELISKIWCEKFTVPTTCGNPALIVEDFLSNPRYGLGLSSGTLDDDSFINAANYCTGVVESNSGTFEQRFCLDIVLDRGKPVLDHLRDMLSTFRGFLTWSQGVVKLKIEKDEPITQSFNMSNIVEGSFIWRKQSYRDRPNVVKVEFIEPGADKAYRLDYSQAFDDWDIDLSGERRERIFRLIGIKRRTQAQRMAQFFLDQAIHIVHAISFRVGIAALESEVGDVVDVTHDVPAFNKKQFHRIVLSDVTFILPSSHQRDAGSKSCP